MNPLNRLNQLFSQSRFSLARLVILILLVASTAGALKASFWQWGRSQYHEALALQATQQQVSKTVLNLNDGGSNSVNPVNPVNPLPTIRDGDTVSVQGKWVAGSTTWIAPRLMAGYAGAWAVSVLQYADAQGNHRYLAVHRGWAQQAQPNVPPSVAELPLNSTVFLQGEQVAALPKAFELQAPNLQALGLWQNYDRAAHARLLNLPLGSFSPFILVLAANSPDADASVLKRPLPEQRSEQWVQKAATNRGYAFQWLGLCIVGLIGLGILFFKQ